MLANRMTLSRTWAQQEQHRRHRRQQRGNPSVTLMPGPDATARDEPSPPLCLCEYASSASSSPGVAFEPQSVHDQIGGHARHSGSRRPVTRLTVTPNDSRSSADTFDSVDRTRSVLRWAAAFQSPRPRC